MDKSGKTFSIRAMLLLPMLLVNLLIVAIFAIAIVLSGFDTQIRDADLTLLQNTTQSRAASIQENFDDMRYMADSMAWSLQQTIRSAFPATQNIAEAARTSPELVPLLLDACTSDLLRVLELNRKVTGAFVVLDASALLPDGGLGGTQAAAVYILDSHVAPAARHDSSLSLYCGPAGSSAPALAPHAGWMEELALSRFSSTSFLLEPYRAAAANPSQDSSAFGYWEKSLQRPDGTPVLTYTLPLRDPGGTPYGVAGLEITMDQLKSWLPASELGYSDNAFYAISAVEGQAIHTDWVASNGIFAFRYLDEPSVFQWPIENSRSAVGMRFGDAEATLVFQPLRSQAPNKSFNGETWALIAGVDNKALHQEANHLLGILWLSVGFAMLVGIFFSLLCSYLFVVPVTRLANYLRTADPEDEIRLSPTRIKEIDLLIDSIEQISAQMIEMSKRTAQSIEMTEMPIGFFEVNEAKQRVYMTDYLFELFGIPKSEEGNFISLQQYHRISESLMRSENMLEPNIYMLEASGRQMPTMLRIRITANKGRSFGIVIDVTEDILARRRLEQERDTDPLTGLCNRTAFFHHAHKRLAEAPDLYGVMLFADLDDLKFINDTYGHDFGDRYICAAANMFRRFLHKNGIISRIAGDEFAFFLYGYSDRDTLAKVIADTFSEMDDVHIGLPDGNPFKIRCSIGFAWYPEDSDDLEQLLRYADFAMYETKRSVKGSIREFNIESYLQNSYLLEKNEDFSRFLEFNQVRYAFQPIVDIHSGKVFAYEALMRPTSPAFSTPDEILQVAHAQAKLYQVERMTLFNLCAWIAENQQLMGDCVLFIKSISGQMLSITDRNELADHHGELFSKIVIELLTGSGQADQGSIEAKVKMVRQLGGEIAVRDYDAGTHDDVPAVGPKPDYIKISRSTIKGVHCDPAKQAIVMEIVKIARDKKAAVIAEGVETAEDAEMMIMLGADYMQGYYLCRPSFTPECIPDEIAQEIQGFAVKHRERRIGTA